MTRTARAPDRVAHLLLDALVDHYKPAMDELALEIGALEEQALRYPARETIARDVRYNFKPLAVIATVGTTSSASVDPVPEIAKICRQERIWLHIDAAYGGGFAMLPEYKWATNGWE